jgi:hypothetical protein
MNSASSTSRPGAGRDAGLQSWHFFLLLAMGGATWAVIEARHTHPAALILISAAILAAGAVAITTHSALAGFFGMKAQAPVLSGGLRQALEQEKALVLRSIKELEFDRAMRKVGDADFAEMDAALRLRALDLMEQLDRTGVAAEVDVPVASDTPVCPTCRAMNDPDAKFCKHCGARLS